MVKSIRKENIWEEEICCGNCLRIYQNYLNHVNIKTSGIRKPIKEKMYLWNSEKELTIKYFKWLSSRTSYLLVRKRKGKNPWCGKTKKAVITLGMHILLRCFHKSSHDATKNIPDGFAMKPLKFYDLLYAFYQYIDETGSRFLTF